MNKPNSQPPPEPYYRATFSLPAGLAKDINRLSKRLGVSQSAFLTELLKDPVAAMLDVIDQLPPSGGTADDLRRARGRSREYIEQIMREAHELSTWAGGKP